jgi:hypothetical protein
VLIDQMLVEVLADGSRLEEVHQLRRINDLQGVEAMKTPPEPAHADELLLLRTVVDGQSYVPSRTGGTFAMPRLCPGAFVEWRYRNRVRSPGAEPWRAPQFLFGDADEPDLLAEFVLVLPAGGRGELRRRGDVPTPSEQPLADGRKALVFRRTDAPRLPEEHDAPPATELLPLLQYGEDSQLAAYARQVHASLLQQTRPTPIVQQKAAAIADALQGDAKIAAIHRYTQTEIAEGPDEGPTAAVLRGKGERFLVELALLRAAGCQVDFAVVAPAREDLLNRGRPLFVGDDALPLPAARIAGEHAPIWLFADAPRHLPLGLVPGGRAGAAALIANEHGDELVTLPATAGDIAQRFAVSGTAVLAASGEVACSGSIAFTDVIAFNLAEQLRDLKADVRKLAARQLAQRFFPEWRPVTASLRNLEPPGQTPAVEFTFARRQLQRDGDRCLLPLPLPQGHFLAAFGDRPGRELPLHLLQEMAADWSILFDPGDSFTVTALPAPVLLRRGPLTYSLRCVPEAGKVRIERHAVLRAATIPPTELAEWLLALQAVDAADASNLVLAPK